MANKIITKGSAYIYLKTLLEKSKIFPKHCKKIRKALGIEVQKQADPTLYPSNWQELENKKQYFDLGERSEFVEFCDYFFLPESFRLGFAVYLHTGHTAAILDTSIHVMTSSKPEPQLMNDKKFLVPYTAIYVPVGVSREKLQKQWKIISENQNLANAFMYGVHKWKDSTPFDAALIGYRFKRKDPKTKPDVIMEAIRAERVYNSLAAIPFGEVRKNMKHIEKQICALKNWYELYF